ncbi:unnamed protein product, partial [Vitis vinifera]|uniref:Uncharacterized protein n=1 Tax=Vitis vinifera TaxID=29760 RepID=D7U687_VITVI
MLLAVIFQNIFPTIGITLSVKLSSCQRIVLLNHKDTKLISF